MKLGNTLTGRKKNETQKKAYNDNMKIKMKTPLTYYGGKQKLCSTILEILPDHKLYCEPFVGGGAVFFGKEPSETVMQLGDGWLPQN